MGLEEYHSKELELEIQRREKNSVDEGRCRKFAAFVNNNYWLEAKSYLDEFKGSVAVRIASQAVGMSLIKLCDLYKLLK